MDGYYGIQTIRRKAWGETMINVQIFQNGANFKMTGKQQDNLTEMYFVLSYSIYAVVRDMNEFDQSIKYEHDISDHTISFTFDISNQSALRLFMLWADNITDWCKKSFKKYDDMFTFEFNDSIFGSELDNVDTTDRILQ